MQIETMMSNPSQYNFIERVNFFENQFSKFSISFFLFNPPIFFTLVDNHGNVYVSFSPKSKMDYDSIQESEWLVRIQNDASPKIWEIRDPNYVQSDLSSSPYFATLYARLEDSFRVNFGVVRISVDYLKWFNMIAKETPKLHYYLVNSDGKTVASSPQSTESAFNLSQYEHRRTTDSGHVYYTYIDRELKRIVNYTYYEALDCYLINTVSFSDLFHEVEQMKHHFFILYLALAAGFLVIVVIISATLTNPLRRLQKTMAGAAENRLNVQLRENFKSKEILELSHTFNKMIRDMNELIGKLKTEERQKEAVRFQVLLSQLNPHFLLNILTTVKSLAIRKKYKETHDLCLSLGKLLETSLQSERDLIHLETEMELVGAYIHIQSFRHQDLIKVDRHYEDYLKHALIPKFSLQPLVENCYRHAFWNMDGGGHIYIRAYVEGESLMLEVEDNGTGIAEKTRDERKRRGSGIGLANIRERLQLLYKSDASLDMISLPQGTLVKMKVPLLIANPFRGGDGYVESIDRRG